MTIKQIAIFTISILLCTSVLSQRRDEYKNAINNYFKSSPFDKSPDSLFKELLNDADLVIDTIITATDTSRFYLRGRYKTFNPFLSQLIRLNSFTISQR